MLCTFKERSEEDFIRDFVFWLLHFFLVMTKLTYLHSAAGLPSENGFNFFERSTSGFRFTPTDLAFRLHDADTSTTVSSATRFFLPKKWDSRSLRETVFAEEYTWNLENYPRWCSNLVTIFCRRMLIGLRTEVLVDYLLLMLVMRNLFFVWFLEWLNARVASGMQVQPCTEA